VVPADAGPGLGSHGIGGHGSGPPTPLVPRVSSGPGCARVVRALPCRRSRRTSCGRGRRGGVSSSAPRSRRRPRPPARPPTRRPLRPAGRPHADVRASARVPRWRRCLCCPSPVHLGGAAAPGPSRPVPARMSGYGPAAPRRRASCRSIRRWTRSPSRSRCLHGLCLHGLCLHGFAGGSTTSPRAPRRPPVARLRPCPRPASLGPAPSASRVPFPFRAPAPFQVPAPEPDPCSRAPRGSAPAAPPVHARGHGWLVRPRGRSVAGRSGAARSQPAPSARPRSLDPSLLPSLGARGRSGSRENGCGHAVFRDEGSVAHATTSAARRAEDLLVQPFVPVRGRAALPGDPL
jgi:hypothetical protein